MVLTIPNQTIGNWNKKVAIGNTNEIVAILFGFPMVLDKIEHHSKTEQRATIGTPTAFSIPAPTHCND